MRELSGTKDTSVCLSVSFCALKTETIVFYPKTTHHLHVKIEITFEGLNCCAVVFCYIITLLLLWLQPHSPSWKTKEEEEKVKFIKYNLPFFQPNLSSKRKRRRIMFRFTLHVSDITISSFMQILCPMNADTRIQVQG